MHTPGNFEVVDSFTYLGSENNNRNDYTTKIQKRITKANRCLNGTRECIKSNLIKRKAKVLSYKSLLRSAFMHMRNLVHISKHENMISLYERKILRFIFKGIQENGTWRRSNFELYQSYKESNIVNFLKIQRIKWAGHVVRMNENCTTKKVFNPQLIGTRRKGRSNLRRIDGLEKDLLVSRTKNWRTLAGRKAGLE
ncbi:uncharacterized protein TNCV_2615801 [Trichonephila clavipes]|nr:uncharacterized protein TNCV_2615801 [Trichonephila clavipes]